VLEPRDWVQEGFELAKNFVYAFGPDPGTKDNPVRLDSAYMQRMRLLALRRAALGARRMAAILERELN
jgi:hypothetical protein